jgi:nitric oxide reductase large subunit
MNYTTNYPTNDYSVSTIETNTSIWRFYGILLVVYVILFLCFIISTIEKQEKNEEVAGDTTGYYEKEVVIEMAGIIE